MQVECMYMLHILDCNFLEQVQTTAIFFLEFSV